MKNSLYNIFIGLRSPRIFLIFFLKLFQNYANLVAANLLKSKVTGTAARVVKQNSHFDVHENI